jgi:hypothetical protein
VVYSSNQFKLDPTEATAFEAKMQRAEKAIRKTFLECIRRELDTFFSTYPTVAEGFQLKTWRSGPQAGQSKRPPSGP